MDDYGFMDEQLWLSNGRSNRLLKHSAFSSIPVNDGLTAKGSSGELRLETYSRLDLHERYMSSEEEASPSPDSDSVSQFEGRECHSDEGSRIEKEEGEGVGAEVPETSKESFFEAFRQEVAVAVPILAIGRPKLVDISKVAPMHKRKRVNPGATTEPRNVQKGFGARRTLNITDVPDQMSETAQPLTAPESWLPDNEAALTEEDSDHLPDLHLQKPLSYNDYNPYSLNPPRLSPRNSYSAPVKKPGSVARARKQTMTPGAMASTPGWRGIGRSLSFPKPQPAAPPPPRQVLKKPRMLPRGATERSSTPLIPPFVPQNERGDRW
ncbi:MAG: hypothetical protein OHK93_003989 [Ramalina farinacea]|uniref:Uncharacterized protein n=1 Tax=Ramalina farinacea TaxID=258253 RepID=A0AA43QFX2_9LECA|nr:hypothetical protein [Ramalina farinacea]